MVSFVPCGGRWRLLGPFVANVAKNRRAPSRTRVVRGSCWRVREKRELIVFYRASVCSSFNRFATEHSKVNTAWMRRPAKRIRKRQSASTRAIEWVVIRFVNAHPNRTNARAPPSPYPFADTSNPSHLPPPPGDRKRRTIVYLVDRRGRSSFFFSLPVAAGVRTDWRLTTPNETC